MLTLEDRIKKWLVALQGSTGNASAAQAQLLREVLERLKPSDQPFSQLIQRAEQTKTEGWFRAAPTHVGELLDELIATLREMQEDKQTFADWITESTKRAEAAEREVAELKKQRGNGVLVPEPELKQLQADIAALRDERDRLKKELDGDGSRGSDPVTSLGRRYCMALNNEEIALLRQQISTIFTTLARVEQKMLTWAQEIEDAIESGADSHAGINSTLQQMRAESDRLASLRKD